MPEEVTGQLSQSAADVYEEFFVPALFQKWAEIISDTAKLAEGDHVLDIACGTGALSRAVLEKVRPDGRVTGLDLSEGMLATAKRVEPVISWQQGAAESLPFDDASFDAVVSQFGLMFFSDRAKGLAEMWRVLKEGGPLTVAVWDSLENTPGYAAAADLLQRLFGDEVANEIRGPYSLGNIEELRQLFDDAGIRPVDIQTRSAMTYYPSIEDWMHLDVKGWTIGDMITDAQYELLVEEAKKDLARFVQDDGQAAFPSPAHIVTAIKPSR